MDISPWIMASIVSKVMIYSGAAAAIGGSFAILLVQLTPSPTPFRRNLCTAVIATALCLGIIAAIIDFFLQVGNFSENGLAGMFDGMMIGLLWDSPVGNAMALKVTAMLIALVVLLITAYSRPAPSDPTDKRLFTAVPLLVSSIILGYAFSLTGHSADLSLPANLAISIHTIAAFWWVGSLYPLWRATAALDPLSLQTVMHRFGQIATVIVAILAIAGGVLLYLLIGAPHEMVTSGYGLMLSAKLFVVAVILLLAARHKWSLTPYLASTAKVTALRHSIAWEGCVAAAILIITAILSTAMGPVSLS